MTTLINAVASTGLTQTADGSGIIKVQSNGVTTNALAWVRFDGTAASPTAAASYNVTSITKNATGDYTITFTNALADTNYCASWTVGPNQTGAGPQFMLPRGIFFSASGNVYQAPTTTTCRVSSGNSAGTTYDTISGMLVIFGN